MKKLSFLIIALILFVSCNTNNKTNSVQIGSILPLTGDMASYGNKLKRGMDLACEIINLDSTLKLEIVYEDGQGVPNKSAAAFQKLNTNSNISMIIGPMFSATTLAVAPIAEKNQKVLLSPTASSVNLTSSGDYIFRIYPSDTYDGVFLANYTINTIKPKTVAIFYENVASVSAIAEIFNKNLLKTGINISSFEGYDPQTTNFKPALIKIKQQNPDLLFFPGTLNNMAIVLKQANEIGLDCKFLTISTFFDKKIIELAGSATENVLFSAPMFSIENQSSEMIDFRNKFKEKYDDEPDILAGYGFDVVNIAYESIINSDKTPQSIKDALYKIQNYPGVTGNTSFDKNGDVQKELQILTVKDSQFSPLSTDK